MKTQLAGTIFTTGSLQVAEMIGMSGFDWVMLDMEHSALSVEAVQNALPVLGDKILKIVRVPGNDEIWIKRVLDTGCDGVLIPMIMNMEEAEKAVSASRYPTTGRRSAGLSRAHGYGMNFSEYLQKANNMVHVMIQIEHIDAVKNIDSILSVNGIDSIFIGPYDLSASMGLMGQVTHPDVLSAIDLIKSGCRDKGLPYGIFGSSPEVLQREIKDGCRFILCGIDITLMSGALINLSENLRKIIP